MTAATLAAPPAPVNAASAAARTDTPSPRRAAPLLMGDIVTPCEDATIFLRDWRADQSAE